MNSKCGVQSKRRCKSHEFRICIVGFPAMQVSECVGFTFCTKNTTHPLQRGIAGSSEKQEKQLLKGNSERRKKKKKGMQTLGCYLHTSNQATASACLLLAYQ